MLFCLVALQAMRVDPPPPMKGRGPLNEETPELPLYHVRTQQDSGHLQSGRTAGTGT